MPTCDHIKNDADAYLYRRKSDGQCRLCRHEIYKRHYEANKDTILAKNAEYRRNNPEKIREIETKRYIEALKTYKLHRKKKIGAEILDTKSLYYATKLKEIITTIAEVNRRYRQYLSAEKRRTF